MIENCHLTLNIEIYHSNSVNLQYEIKRVVNVERFLYYSKDFYILKILYISTVLKVGLCLERGSSSL